MFVHLFSNPVKGIRGIGGGGGEQPGVRSRCDGRESLGTAVGVPGQVCKRTAGEAKRMGYALCSREKATMCWFVSKCIA